MLSRMPKPFLRQRRFKLDRFTQYDFANNLWGATCLPVLLLTEACCGIFNHLKYYGKFQAACIQTARLCTTLCRISKTRATVVPRKSAFQRAQYQTQLGLKDTLAGGGEKTWQRRRIGNTFLILTNNQQSGMIFSSVNNLRQTNIFTAPNII